METKRVWLKLLCKQLFLLYLFCIILLQSSSENTLPKQKDWGKRKSDNATGNQKTEPEIRKYLKELGNKTPTVETIGNHKQQQNSKANNKIEKYKNNLVIIRGGPYWTSHAGCWLAAACVSLRTSRKPRAGRYLRVEQEKRGK